MTNDYACTYFRASNMGYHVECERFPFLGEWIVSGLVPGTVISGVPFHTIGISYSFKRRSLALRKFNEYKRLIYKIERYV